MSIFRRTRLNDAQLREVLQSLPQVKAPADFEEHLDRMITLHGEYVPHMLGAMPMVPAPDDFDARLMEAIDDKSRPVAPIPAAMISGGMAVNWLNHIMGWIGGSLAVVTIAFFINRDVEVPDVQPAAAPAPAHAISAPAATQPVVTGSVGTPSAAHAAAPGTPGNPSHMTAAAATESAAATSVHEEPVPVTAVASQPRRNQVNVSEHVVSVAPAPVNATISTPAHHDPVHVDAPVHTDAVSVTPPSQGTIDTHTVAPPPGAQAGGDTTTVTSERNIPEVVNTGRPQPDGSDPKNK